MSLKTFGSRSFAALTFGALALAGLSTQKDSQTITGGGGGGRWQPGVAYQAPVDRITEGDIEDMVIFMKTFLATRRR